MPFTRQALVEAARELGWAFSGRTPGCVTLTHVDTGVGDGPYYGQDSIPPASAAAAAVLVPAPFSAASSLPPVPASPDAGQPVTLTLTDAGQPAAAIPPTPASALTMAAPLSLELPDIDPNPNPNPNPNPPEIDPAAFANPNPPTPLPNPNPNPPTPLRAPAAPGSALPTPNPNPNRSALPGQADEGSGLGAIIGGVAASLLFPVASVSDSMQALLAPFAHVQGPAASRLGLGLELGLGHVQGPAASRPRRAQLSFEVLATVPFDR